MSKIDIEPEILESLYWGNEYDTYMIASIFGCSDVTIGNRLKEHSIPRRLSYDLTDFRFNNRQKQIFEGCMLGDGNLVWRGTNCIFSDVDMHEEYLIWLQGELNISSISRITPIYHFKGAGAPYEYLLRTRLIPSIREEHKIWYPYKTRKGTHQHKHYKIIPKDIELTLIKVLFWFLGDGWYYKERETVWFTTYLSLDTAVMLINKLKVLLDVNEGITYCKSHKDRNGNQCYSIRLDRIVSNMFFDMVDSLGFDIPDCYQYKFGR